MPLHPLVAAAPSSVLCVRPRRVRCCGGCCCPLAGAAFALGAARPTSEPRRGRGPARPDVRIAPCSRLEPGSRHPGDRSCQSRGLVAVLVALGRRVARGWWAWPRPRARRGRPPGDADAVPSLVTVVAARRVVLVLVVLTGDAGARARLGLSDLAGLSRAASRLASSRRNDSTRLLGVGPRPPPRRARTRARLAVGAAARAVRRSARRGRGTPRSGGRARRAPARTTGCPGCRRSSRRPRAAASISADVDVCRPRPVTALTCPIARSASGHQSVDQRRLADAAVPDEHADPAAQPLADARRGRRRAAVTT